MTYNFCTLFDSYYFSRGIVLYNSLKANCENFHLYIFAFDDIAHQKLISLNLNNVTVISLSEFEDKELLEVKNKRSKAEYCWTSTASTILYAIKSFNLESCTYIDADIYFYSDPKELFEEIAEASIALTLHNYSELYDQSSTSGKYCVQFVYFKNDLNGIAALEWWRRACIDWCYARLENGKFGDQKYLDDWTERFDNVHVVKNMGAGLALWNAQRFKIDVENSKIIISDINTGRVDNLIFYHFHGLKCQITNSDIIIEATKFRLDTQLKEIIYTNYVNEIVKIDYPHIRELKLNFGELTPIVRFFLPLHFLLKKSALLQKIKAIFVHSMK